MEISVTEAQRRLGDLVRRAEAGEEIVLTQDGTPAVRLEAVQARRKLSKEEKLRRLRELSAKASKEALPGPSAARSQDFLYDKYGLPK